MTSIDDLLAAIERNTDAQRDAQRLVVGTSDACALLGGIGWDHLDSLVTAGRLTRMPNMRGPGNGHLYAVRELERFAATGILRSELRVAS
jgi:hypothetical protein